MFKIFKSAFSFFNKPTKLALVVRSDIKMTKGKTASQCSHASIICYEKSIQHKPDLLKYWISSGQPKIVLKVDSLKDIEEIEKNAKELSVISAIVRDAGRTHLDPGTVTVIGIGPDYNEVIDKLVGNLKLL